MRDMPAVEVLGEVRKKIERLLAIPEVQAIIPLAKHETWVEFGGWYSVWVKLGWRTSRMDISGIAECPRTKGWVV